jgi:hypothetical protein
VLDLEIRIGHTQYDVKLIGDLCPCAAGIE